MSKSQLEDLLDKYEKGLCTEDELATLHRFFGSFQTSEDVWEEIGVSRREEVGTHIFSKVDEWIDANQPVVSTGSFRVWRVAAVVAMLLAFGWVAFQYLADQQPSEWLILTTAPGERQTVKLADGSTVRLNSASSIEYPGEFGDLREVKVTGEAFFEVAKDTKRPFVVHAGETQITVLGTSFNVAVWDSMQVDVALVEGKVRFSAPAYRSRQEAILSPGQVAHWEGETDALEITQFDQQHTLAWKDGILMFQGENIREISRQMERWFGVSIRTDRLTTDACELRVTFDPNTSLRQVMNQLKILTGIDYQFITVDEVSISGNACQPQ